MIKTLIYTILILNVAIIISMILAYIYDKVSTAKVNKRAKKRREELRAIFNKEKNK